MRHSKFNVEGVIKLLSAVPLNAEEAQRTLILNTLESTAVGITVKLTRSSATTIVVTPSVSYDDGATYGRVTIVDKDKAEQELVERIDAMDVDASGVWEFPKYDVGTADKLKLVFFGADADAGDLIDVYATGLNV